MVYLKLWKFSQEMQAEFSSEPRAIYVGPLNFVQVTYQTLRIQRVDRCRNDDDFFARYHESDGTWKLSDLGWTFSDFSIFPDSVYQEILQQMKSNGVTRAVRQECEFFNELPASLPERELMF